MAFNGSGIFSRLYDWTADRDAGVKIRADRMDEEIDGIATALSNVICKDGQSTPTANIPLGGFKLTGLGTPTADGDAATKAYVDGAAASIVNFTVRGASTANVNLTSDVDAGSTFDGLTLVEADRILLKNQSDASENGIYAVPAALGTATRVTDMDDWAEVLGAIISVTAGTQNADTSWRSTANTGGTLDTTDLNFVAHGSSVTLPLALGSGGTGRALTDPGADRFFGWDESADQSIFFSATLPIAFSGTAVVLDINGSTDLAAPATGDEMLLGDISNSNAIRKADVASVLALKTESFVIACSDETTALTTGTAKVKFRMPYAFTLTAVRASLSTAQSSGSIFTVDVNESGTTVLSTKLTIDNSETTSTTAVTAAVISDSALADDAEISIDIDQIGNGTAKGLKVVLIGHQ